MPRLFKSDNKVDMVKEFLTEVQKVYGLSQVTVYCVHESYKRIF